MSTVPTDEQHSGVQTEKQMLHCAELTTLFFYKTKQLDIMSTVGEWGQI